MKFRALGLFCFLFCSLVVAPPFVSRAQAQVSSPPPYVSEMRDECIAEMAKDPQIRAACEAQYTSNYREQDARQATKDKKHVVWAYGALWGIVTIFVVGLWLRQRKLSAEIARLEAELRKAAAE